MFRLNSQASWPSAWRTRSSMIRPRWFECQMYRQPSGSLGISWGNTNPHRWITNASLRASSGPRTDRSLSGMSRRSRHAAAAVKSRRTMAARNDRMVVSGSVRPSAIFSRASWSSRWPR